jgi:cytochrome c oxidase subunit IV
MKNDKIKHKMWAILFSLSSLICLVDFIKFTTGYYHPSNISIALYMIMAFFLFILSISNELDKSK